MFVILYTIQPNSFYQSLLSDKIIRCDGRKSTYLIEDRVIRKITGNQNYGHFEYAYKWMTKQMQERNIQKDHKYPLWAWYKYSEHNKAPPISGYEAKKYLNFSETYVRLKINVPNNLVLLSDFEDWHYVINNIYIGDPRYCVRIMNAEDRGDFKYQDIKEKSWQTIFNITYSDIIQACIPRIEKKWIVKVNYYE